MKKIALSTIELRNLLKTDFELFDFYYDFDDKNFASKLEQVVIDHYYFYEIGQETPERFKHTFKRKWLQAMSYYNELHNTTLLEYNPLVNYKMSELMEQLKETDNTQDMTGQTDTSTTTDDTQNTNNTRTNNLTTEQTGTDYPQQNISSGNYASDKTVTNDTGTVTDDVTSTNIQEQTGQNTDTQNITGNVIDNLNYEKNIEGITGITYQELIQKERDNLIRITGMVIEEMKDCFMLVY